MAAGCLILGHAPAEMIEFFGYNPVIEADPVRPAEQLSSILAHLDEHQDLVDRNREAVVRMGDWQERAKEIVATSQRIASGSAR
jgi:hypothetical protein